MARKARQKRSEAIYHIMCRSISEVPLFKDDADKDYYLELLKRYIEKFKCSIYAYSLMDNHLHIHLDPKGFDVSKFMHSTNTAYVNYYNAKHNRRGPLFQGRFVSKILDTNEYNLAVSAYIHNNAKDIEGYNGREEYYRYSSYGIYLGIRRDFNKLVDTRFVMGLFNTKNKKRFAQRYIGFVSHQRNIEDLKEFSEKLSMKVEYEYRSGREIILRDLSPSKAISLIANELEIEDKYSIAIKGNRKFIEYRAFCAYVLRTLGGLSYKDICRHLHNITISGCSRLCDKGYELLSSDNPVYLTLFDELVNHAA